MPSFDAFTLIGRSSKWSSLGSEGRTRTGRAILALWLTRLFETCFSRFSGMAACALESECGWAANLAPGYESYGQCAVSDAYMEQDEGQFRRGAIKLYG